MTLKERLHLGARGDIFTVITSWSRITNVKDFFLTCFEDCYLNLKIKSEYTTDDGRHVVETEG